MSHRGASVVVLGACEKFPHTGPLLATSGFEVLKASSVAEVFQLAMLQPPHCILVCWAHDAPATSEVIAALRAEPLHAHLPILILVEEADFPYLDLDAVQADDFWLSSARPNELVARVRLNIIRSGRQMDANPLTRFPGNTTISREIQRRLGDDVAWGIAYLDIDFFKAFNDKYGYARGDEVLRMTGRILANAALRRPGGFVGHIGGDDFMFMVRADQLDDTCREILGNFDSIVPSFYDDEDRLHGHIASEDRKGDPMSYPLMSCSIAAIDTGHSTLVHVADVSQRMAEIKKVSKNLLGSSFIVDRRL
jgi:GGDEF domain-containing protein